MNNVSRFERAFVDFDSGEKVDCYKLSNGECRFGLVASSLAIGYNKAWLSQVLISRKKVLQALHGRGFVGDIVEGIISRNTGDLKVKTISFDDFKILLNYSCEKKKEKALILKGIKSNKKRKIRQTESEIRDTLKNIIGGETEVKTLAGKIDLLTNDEIIELKSIKSWKSALGQILVYGDYYPNHQKRIHLFGETQKSYLDMVIKHCKKRNVIVTYESTKKNINNFY